MEIQKDVLVTLNADDKAVCLKSLRDLFYATKQIYDWIKEDTLTVEMKETLLNLVEHHTADTAKVLGYDSESEKKIKERYAEIRQANQRIHELKRKLAENTPTDGLPELLYSLRMAVNDWWHKQGFNLVTDENFGIFGFKGRFCLDIRSLSFMTRKPVTEKQNKKNRLEQMIAEGYEFEIEDRDYVLLDTPGNRERITALLKSKFPSLDISKWGNWCLHKKEGFQLRDCECYIRNLSE
jgi:hypothetical protein